MIFSKDRTCLPVLLENRSRFVLVTLQACIQRTIRRRSVVRLTQSSSARAKAGTLVIHAIVQVCVRAARGVPEVQVALVARRAVEYAQSATHLARGSQIFAYIQKMIK